MKRGFITAIFLFLIVINLPNIYASTIKTEELVITGSYATLTNVSIAVINLGPMLNIFNPKEDRAYRNESILLNYSVFDPEGISLVWYNIDGGVNISLGSGDTGLEYFNTAEGSHTLYLYANDTLGSENFTSVDFFANNTKIIVWYETFRGTSKGDSTNFDSLTDSALENLSEMTLEHIDYGKILWQETVNITEDENPADRITTIDYNVVISNNTIIVNATVLPNLDESARLWFYNLTFDVPQILRNGVICPDSVCFNDSYANGTLRVDVAGFSGFANYSVEETSEAPFIKGGSGGGGGAPTVKVSDFTLNKEKIKVSLKQGETKTAYFRIKNTGKKKLKMKIETSDIGNFVKINKKEFNLVIGESETITLDFIAREEIIPDVYIGKIMISGEGIVKEILVVIEVESKEPLFDVKVKILPKFLKIIPGDEIVAITDIYNLGKLGRVDIQIDYIIKDDESSVLLSEHETLAVETQLNLVKTFKIPKSAKPGKYILYVKVMYDQKTASSSAFFTVISEDYPTETEFIKYIFSFVILIIMIIIYYFIKKSKRKLKKSKRKRKETFKNNV